MILSKTDLSSVAWSKVSRHIEKKLFDLRSRIEKDVDPIATAKLRGEIKSYKDLLALGKPDPAMVANDEPE